MSDRRNDEQWIRLKKANDWGSDYIAMNPYTKTGGASSRQALKIRDGEELEVLMPDGTVMSAKIAIHEHQGTVGDMGHTYDTTSRVPFALASFHGLDVAIDLTKVDVRREWAEAHSPR